MTSLYIPIEVESSDCVKITASSEISQGKDSSTDQYFQQNYQVAIFEKTQSLITIVEIQVRYKYHDRFTLNKKQKNKFMVES